MNIFVTFLALLFVFLLWMRIRDITDQLKRLGLRFKKLEKRLSDLDEKLSALRVASPPAEETAPRKAAAVEPVAPQPAYEEKRPPEKEVAPAQPPPKKEPVYVPPPPAPPEEAPPIPAQKSLSGEAPPKRPLMPTSVAPPPSWKLPKNIRKVLKTSAPYLSI